MTNVDLRKKYIECHLKAKEEETKYNWRKSIKKTMQQEDIRMKIGKI